MYDGWWLYNGWWLDGQFWCTVAFKLISYIGSLLASSLNLAKLKWFFSDWVWFRWKHAEFKYDLLSFFGFFFLLWADEWWWRLTVIFAESHDCVWRDTTQLPIGLCLCHEQQHQLELPLELLDRWTINRWLPSLRWGHCDPCRNAEWPTELLFPVDVLVVTVATLLLKVKLEWRPYFSPFFPPQVPIVLYPFIHPPGEFFFLFHHLEELWKLICRNDLNCWIEFYSVIWPLGNSWLIYQLIAQSRRLYTHSVNLGGENRNSWTERIVIE